MYLAIIMAVVIIISISFGILFLIFSSKEKQPIIQATFWSLGLFCLFMASAGLLGMIAKTFELWGNSW